MNVRDKIMATGMIIVPVLRYSFGDMKWILEELRNTGRLEEC
jgi:hypothetical protein